MGMKLSEKIPPRRFVVGTGLAATELRDCGTIALEPDEQVTFVSDGGREYDVCRKSWGYYATPSTNSRLSGFGFRTALVLNAIGRLFVMIVERERCAEFEAYCALDGQRVLVWLDDPGDVERLIALAPLPAGPTP